MKTNPWIIIGTLTATAAAALCWLPSPQCWAVVVIVDGLLVARIVMGFFPAQDLIARLRGFVWFRPTFCQHFLITGATGAGKTLSGIMPIMLEMFRRQPKFGGLCVDMKGVLHNAIVEMAARFGRPNDVLVLEVRGVDAPPDWKPSHRFNLVGDRRIPYATYARCVVDTAVALGNRHEQSFFRRAAQIHIAKALEALEAIGYEVTLENAHNLLVNAPDTQAALRKMEALPAAAALAEHFRNYLAQPPEQLAGITGTVGNYLHYFTQPAIAEVFCRDSTFALREVDDGKLLCLALPQTYQTERRFVGTFLKLLFYQHALARFDAPKSVRAGQNLLLLLVDEYQHFVTLSEDGVSDHVVVDVIREAGVALVAATQSTTSLLPVLGTDAAKVLTLNLRNRLIFTAADEDDARASAEFIGRTMRPERSSTYGAGRHSVTLHRREDYVIKPGKLRKLRKHQCVIVHCEQGHARVTLPPRLPDGSIPRWYWRWWFTR